MIFNDETRTRLLWTGTMSADPTGSTVTIKVDSTWYAATWIGSPVQSGAKWVQTARTTGYFAGPAHLTPAGAVVLALGRHICESNVKQAGGDEVVYSAMTVDVRAL